MSSGHHTFELGDISFDVTRKRIKNIYLRVCLPQGRVAISAPMRMSLETIRLFSISKLGWIRKQQEKLKHQTREMPKEYIDHEPHDYLGRKYELKIVETKGASEVILKQDTLELHIRKKTSVIQKKQVMQGWYKQQLKLFVSQYVLKLEKIMNVTVAEVCVRTMKTRWGTCNVKAKRIWLNTELAKKSIESIEYIITHEMVHLLEPSHNKKFKVYMDTFLPQWRVLKQALNQSALGYVEP